MKNFSSRKIEKNNLKNKKTNGGFYSVKSAAKSSSNKYLVANHKKNINNKYQYTSGLRSKKAKKSPQKKSSNKRINKLKGGDYVDFNFDSDELKLGDQV